MRSYTMLSEGKRFGNATLEKIEHPKTSGLSLKKEKEGMETFSLDKKINDTSLYPFSVQRTMKPIEQSKSYF